MIGRGEGDRLDRIASLYGRRLTVLGAGLQAADGVILGALALFSLLIVVFWARLPAPGGLLLRIMGWTAFYIAAIYIGPILPGRALRSFVRMAAVMILCGQLYFVSARMELVFIRSWQDPALLAFENAVFGAQPTIWLQRIIAPPLTEWMMFAYVIYLVIYPALGALIYFRRGEKPLEDYLFVLAVTNIACFLGFLAFPIAGPLYYKAVAYTVPLKGGFFTACGEYIRKNIHEIGGNIPSPHCAIATVMWIMARRYLRPAFYVLAPVILSLYISTFYLRYHYLTDSIVGILTGALMIGVSPALVRAWNAAAGRVRAVKE